MISTPLKPKYKWKTPTTRGVDNKSGKQELHIFAAKVKCHLLWKGKTSINIDSTKTVIWLHSSM